MTLPQILITLILVATLALFLWGRFRHDVVALASLMACVLAGLVEPDAAFAGFGHPAVITVACILVMSQGLQNTGAVDWLARSVLPRNAGRTVSLVALIGLGAALSGFMNNVGAMALLMPIAVQLSGRIDLTPGQVLMPLAFGTILGGMTTLVGTPPNLIVSGFRREAGGAPFEMFDFAPVGLAVAVLGVLFLALFWRLVPARKPAGGEGFDTGSYLTEVRIPAKSKAVGLTLRAFEREIAASGAQIATIVRNEVRMTAPHGGRIIREDDVLMLLADVNALAEALSVFGIKLEQQKPAPEKAKVEAAETEAGAEAEADVVAPAEALVAEETAAEEGAETAAAEENAPEEKAAGERDEEIVLRELAVLPSSSIVGRSASDLKLRTRYGLNLLAVSRAHQPPRARLREVKLQSGDLLMMQGPAEVMADFINESGCVPLGERELRIPDKRMALIAGAIMLVSVLVVTLGLLPAAAAFALGLLATMLAKTVPLRQIYTSIDWPVVVLLAALIPVAGAMQTTGAADLLSRFLVETIAQGNAVAALAVVLIVTMTLSDVMNNAATAAVLCPIAIGIASALGVNPDSFLMAVAIGSSCAFLTPIGHQNNTLILGPGGFRFSDYWRLGLPLELLVVVVSLPLLLWVWPL
ncbi:SLC13 family permease [Frigidibacter albus]|uniref:SLC13 family permease n=2 Tax=Frigidibacter albus TaxID=1465486 RepID=A0A6L8VG47_9RHOB|nr:SLC13 family permease [Frigidibacter albus]MZQ88279.1 SLC13 family permease [Frigidibacter albus]NBE30047.1 SLC13 family permease [Frigidibacter albus]